MEKKYSTIGKRFNLCNTSNYSDISEIEQAAFNFCFKHKVKITGVQIDKRTDNLCNDIKGNEYRITIHYDNKQFSFFFSDSVYNKEHNKIPSCYDVLACITKYDPENMEYFISEYGYEITSYKGFKDVERIYKSVKREYNSIIRLFGNNTDVYAELCEIW